MSWPIDYIWAVRQTVHIFSPKTDKTSVCLYVRFWQTHTNVNTHRALTLGFISDVSLLSRADKFPARHGGRFWGSHKGAGSDSCEQHGVTVELGEPILPQSF